MPINYSAQDESPPAASIFEKTGGVLDRALESPSDNQNINFTRETVTFIFMQEQDINKKI